jgi:hypothetical protein
MNRSTEKSFGILFFFVLMIIAFYPILNSEKIRFLLFIPAFIFLILAYLKPNLLKPLNLAWVKLGEILGRVLAPIVMFLLFFIIVTPIGLLVRLFGKDLLKIKFTKDDSYWIKREKNIGTMKKQF